MFKSLLLTLCALVCVLCAPEPRIIGGSDTSITDFPWQVSITRDGIYACGGAIVSDTMVITTANCMDAISDLTAVQVRLGSNFWSHGGMFVQIAGYVKHPGYNWETMEHNIALVRLAVSELNFGLTVQSIPLAKEAPANGATAELSGWGITEPGVYAFADRLQAVELDVIDRKECSSSAYAYGQMISNTMFCAAAPGKDMCLGDFGSPLVHDGALVGIASWARGCNKPEYPGVYVNIVAELEFINGVLG